MESLQVKPFTSPLVDAFVRLPGSKSISNRALLLAAVSDSQVVLDGLLRSEDTELMLDCLKTLGVVISEESATRVSVSGAGSQFPVTDAELFVGTAGTVARLLIGVLGVQRSGRFKVDGSEVMRARPMKGLIDLLRDIGCEFEFLGEPDSLPFVMNPHGFRCHRLQVDASASSQVLSAILMAAALADEDVEIELSSNSVRKPYVIMTAKMMESFSGPKVFWNNSFTQFSVRNPKGYHFYGSEYSIESDASAASYFLTLPFVTGGSLDVYNFDENGLQGDVGYLDVLRKLGARTKTKGAGVEISFSKSDTPEIDWDFYPISDTFMTLAAVSPLMSAPVRISGIAHTRKQESNRVSATVAELRKLGQDVHEEEDFIRIFPDMDSLKAAAQKGVSIDTYKDHRISMSFGILGSQDVLGNGKPWMTIQDPLCCEKTFPTFFDVLEDLRGES